LFSSAAAVSRADGQKSIAAERFIRAAGTAVLPLAAIHRRQAIVIDAALPQPVRPW